MKSGGHKFNLKSSSALVIAAGCTVALMLFVTIISFVLYRKSMLEASDLLQEVRYKSYDYYVAMISSDDSSDFWQQVFSSAEEYGSANGIYIDMLSDNVEGNYTKDELLEMAIASGCDGILLEGDDSEQTAALITKAASAGIPVITLENDVDSEYRASFVGVNNYTVANLYATSLLDNLVKQKHVMIIGDSSVDENYTNNFVNNVQEALSDVELPNGPLEFEIRLIDNDGAFATEEYIQNLFQKNEIQPVVICLDETSTECFYQAMIDYNKVGQVLLFGNYESQAIYTGIKQGVIKSTITLNASSLGQEAVKAYIEYEDTGHVSEYISVEPKLIDASNIDEYLEEVDDGKE